MFSAVVIVSIALLEKVKKFNCFTIKAQVTDDLIFFFLGENKADTLHEMSSLIFSENYKMGIRMPPATQLAIKVLYGLNENYIKIT